MTGARVARGRTRMGRPSGAGALWPAGLALAVLSLASLLTGCSPAPTAATSIGSSTTASPTTAAPTTASPTTASPTTAGSASSAAPRASRSPSPTRSRAATLQPLASATARPAHPSPAPMTRSAARRAPGTVTTLPVAGSTAGADQVITVAAPAWGSTQANLQAWQRTAAGWLPHGPSTAAWVGAAGLTTNAREGFTGTPVGSFSLTQAFGNAADPGARLPYFQAGLEDWWSGDSTAASYNTHQRCAPSDCPFDTSLSENLNQAGAVYDYAVVIDYNSRPAVPGKGSAFFLHVTAGEPTEGCVSIPRAALIALLRWLDPARHPRIVLGVR